MLKGIQHEKHATTIKTVRKNWYAGFEVIPVT